MANPYSTPSEFTPKRIPLEMFADLAAKKEAEFQQSQLAAAELMGNFNVQEGLLTPGLAARKNKEYTDQVLAIQKQLQDNKDAASAARELVKLQSKYKTDAEVQAGAKDAEMTPKALEYEINNPGGYFGYRDKQGNPVPLDKISSADVYNAYSKVSGAATFKEEDEFYDRIPSETKNYLSDLELVTTPIGDVFYMYGDKRVEVRDVADSIGYKTYLEDNFANRNTAAANNYKVSGKGEDKYITDAVERARLKAINNVVSSRQVMNAPVANASSKGSGSGAEDQSGVKYNVVEGTGGYTAEEMFDPNNLEKISGDRMQLEYEYDNASTPQEQEKIAAKLALIDGPATMYEMTVNEFNDTPEAKKLWTDFKTKNGYSDEYLSLMQDAKVGFASAGYNENYKAESSAILGQNTSLYSPEIRAKWPVEVYTQYKPEVINSDPNMPYNWSKYEDFKAGEYKKEFKRFAKTDNVGEIKTYTVSNAQPNWNEQYQTNFNIALNDGAFDLNGSEFITTGVDKTQKVDLNQEEKARLLTVVNPAKIAYRNVEVAPDGVYLSIKVNNKALADGDSLEEAGWDTDESTSSNYTRVRLKLNKDKLREQFLKQNGGAFEILKSYQEYTTIGESEEGGRVHKSDNPDFLNGIASQIFSVPVISEKVNIASELQKDRPVLEKVYGERDASIVDSPFISTKGIYYEDFASETTVNRKGVQVYYGQDAASKKAVTNNDITSMIANEEFKFSLNDADIQNMTMSDLALEPTKNQFLVSFLNSVMLSNVAVGGSKDKSKREELVGNILDKINTEGMSGQEVINMISDAGVDTDELLSSAFVFKDREQATSYLFRGGKKQTPQRSANPLGVK